jgi:hypothetical protein
VVQVRAAANLVLSAENAKKYTQKIAKLLDYLVAFFCGFLRRAPSDSVVYS